MVTITLPPELERVVTVQAQQQGTTPELLTLDKLREVLLPAITPPPVTEGTLADYLGEFIGCLDSGELIPGGARMSENIGERFAEGMLQKRREGRL
jgi:hypothetical protein